MSGEASSDNGNGRVTLALLGQKVDSLTENQKEFKTEIGEKLDKFISSAEERFRCLEQSDATKTEQIGTIAKDIADLWGQVRSWNLINSIGATLAGIIAYFGLNK